MVRTKKQKQRIEQSKHNILDETVVYQDDSDVPSDMTMLHRVSVITRPDTVTGSFWHLKSFMPVHAEQRWWGKQWVPVADRQWTRSVTYRLVLSYRRGRPRLYWIAPSEIGHFGTSIMEHSNDVERVASSLAHVDAAFNAAVGQRNPEHHRWDRFFPNFAQTRFRFAHDLDVPVTQTAATIPENISAEEMFNVMLWPNSTPQAHAGMLRWLRSEGQFRYCQAKARADMFNVFAHRLAPEDHEQVIAGHLNLLPPAFAERIHPDAVVGMMTDPAPEAGKLVVELARSWEIFFEGNERSLGRLEGRTARTWEELSDIVHSPWW